MAPVHAATEAAIVASQRSEDGEYKIVVQGRRRFAIRSLDRTRAYLRAIVEILDEPLGTDAEVLADAVARLFTGIAETLETRGHAIVDESWKDTDPRALSYRGRRSTAGLE